MLKLTRRVEYGLLAMVSLAEQRPTPYLNAREIADRHEIPLELLAKILQGLVRNGFVRSQHGARGGYSLARPLHKISLSDFVGAVEGPVHLVECESGGECPQEERCSIKEPIARVQQTLQAALAGITLDELVGGRAAGRRELGAK